MHLPNAIKQKGFTFIGLLALMAISGIAMAVVGIVWSQTSQRNKEEALLQVGKAYQQAIVSYYSVDNRNAYPTTLEDLLLDKRYPNIKRHLRRLYLDPITNSQNWGLVKQQGFIIGVYSLSQKSPIKKTGFNVGQEAFAEAKSYQDWKFNAVLGNNNNTQANTTQPSNAIR